MVHAKNTIPATGSLAVPLCRYSFGIVNWNQEELQKLERKMRKLLTIHGQLHLQADVDRLYFPRKQGGRGLKQLEEACAVEITKLVECVDKGRSTNTDCQKTPTQHQLSNFTDSYMLQDRNTERNKTNKGQHSRGNKRKIVRKEEAQTIAT
jgi:hypothetical protein